MNIVFVYPMCKKSRAIECTIQMQYKIWIVHWIALVFLHTGSEKTIENIKMSFIGCVSKHALFFKLFFFSSRPLATMGNLLEILIAGRKYLCVSRKVFLWSKHFGPNVLFNFLITCIYIHIYISYMIRRSYDLDHTIPHGMVCYGMLWYGMVWYGKYPVFFSPRYQWVPLNDYTIIRSGSYDHMGI